MGRLVDGPALHRDRFETSERAAFEVNSLLTGRERERLAELLTSEYLMGIPRHDAVEGRLVNLGIVWIQEYSEILERAAEVHIAPSVVEAYDLGLIAMSLSGSA